MEQSTFLHKSRLNAATPPKSTEARHTRTSEYSVRTVEEWRESILKNTRGYFQVFRDVYHSEAFLALRTKSAKAALVLIDAYEQLWVEKLDNRHSGNRRKYKNGGRIVLTDKCLEVKGVGSPTRIRRLLVKYGFLDVLLPGDFTRKRATVFVPSNRWQLWPNVLPQKDRKPIAYRKYVEQSLSNPEHPIHQKRRERKK